MRGQVRSLVEDDGRNGVFTLKVTNEVNSCMAGHVPLLAMHRPTDVQCKENCILINLGRRLSVIKSWRPVVNACVFSDPMKYLMKVHVADIMILSMCAHSFNKFSDRFGIVILNLHSQNDNIKVSEG